MLAWKNLLARPASFDYRRQVISRSLNSTAHGECGKWKDTIDFFLIRLTKTLLKGSITFPSPLRSIINVPVQRIIPRARTTALGAVFVSAFDGGDDGSQEHAADIDFINRLKKETLMCVDCGLRIVFDRKLPGTTYCTCSKGKPAKSEIDGWKIFIERPDTLVWRK